LADLILVNANIITMNPVIPKARWLAVHDGKILAVASDESFHEYRKGRTEFIDCKGKTVLPGFIDPHFHLHAFAESFVTLNLEPHQNIRSISDIQKKIGAISQKIPPGTWIRARGYNEFYLSEKRHPNRSDLDHVVKDHPIKITHRSGRANVLNSLALKLVGISRETSDPTDGLIDRDTATGEPTGLLFNLGDYLSQKIPPVDQGQMEQGIKLVSRELSSLGITSIHDASSRNNLSRWESIQRWKEKGFLKPRITMLLGKEGFEEHQKHLFSSQMEGNWAHIGGVKIVVHETTGQLSPHQEELNEMVLKIHRSGLQAVFHAIEGKTIEAACDAIEYAMDKFPRQDHRHRIEHCSVCSPSLAKRIASLGVIVVTQPSFIFYNGDRYLRTVPDSNLKHLYPIATLMKNGVSVAGSSDCPIVPANPMIGIYSAISRKTNTGQSILPEEGISPKEALGMYTTYAARAAFEEKIKGSIAAGKLADLVVLNSAPTKLPADEIKDVEVEMTFINGEVVWDKTS